MHWFTILRPLNLLQAALAVLLTTAFLGMLHETQTLLLLILSVILINGGGNVINDIYDIDIDRINRPTRPLPAGRISSRAAWIYTSVLFGLGVILAGQINLATLLVAGPLSISLLIGYSAVFKRLPLIGNLVVSFMLGLAFIYVGAAFGNIGETMVMAALAFGFTLIRELVKDLEDMEGDAQDEARTLPIAWGETKTRGLVLLLMLLFMGLDILPYTLGIYNTTYLIIVLAGINFPLLLTAVLLWLAPGKKNYGRVQLFLKLDIFVGLAALYFGRVL